MLEIHEEQDNELEKEINASSRNSGFDMSNMANMFSGMNPNGQEGGFDMSKMQEMMKGMDPNMMNQMMSGMGSAKGTGKGSTNETNELNVDIDNDDLD